VDASEEVMALLVEAEEAVELVLDELEALFWAALLACRSSSRRLCWLVPETERDIEDFPANKSVYE
jgi:hypothetical protein